MKLLISEDRSWLQHVCRFSWTSCPQSRAQTFMTCRPSSCRLYYIKSKPQQTSSPVRRLRQNDEELSGSFPERAGERSEVTATLGSVCSYSELQEGDAHPVSEGRAEEAGGERSADGNTMLCWPRMHRDLWPLSLNQGLQYLTGSLERRRDWIRTTVHSSGSFRRSQQNCCRASQFVLTVGPQLQRGAVTVKPVGPASSCQPWSSVLIHYIRYVKLLSEGRKSDE